MFLDFIWLPRGFIGMNKCLIPDGVTCSERFDKESKYFQSWIGAYFLNDLRGKHFDDEATMVRYFSKAAVKDQEAWLITYGCIHYQTRLILKSLKFVQKKKINGFEQIIYRGEMFSGLDDSKHNLRLKFPSHRFSTSVASLYNKFQFKPSLLVPTKESFINKDRVRLFGYFSIIKVSKRKCLLTYCCGTVDHEAEIQNELKKVIENVEVIKLLSSKKFFSMLFEQMQNIFT